MEIEVTRLKLAAPLFYSHAEGLGVFPSSLGENEETLFCFELEETQYKSFEPDKGKFFEHLTFAGRALAGGKQFDRAKLFELLPGEYLFSQKREILAKEDAAEAAFEIQQEGLWRRLKLLKTFYLRYLFEDGGGVTQLWRPFRE